MTVLHYELKAHIAHLTIQSPPVNALSTGLIKELDKILDKIEREDLARVIIIKGEGRFFSAGADVKEFTELQMERDYRSLALSGQKVFDRLENFSVPVIAAIHGAALGGGLELAMACNIRIVAEDAKLGMPELNLGIIPGFAGTQRLPHYIGPAKAYEMILTGEAISGKEAERIGLANKAVHADEVLTKANEMAKKIAEKSKPSVQALMGLLTYAKSDFFALGSEAEAKAFGKVFGSEDAKEGIQAFLDKRKPVFKDK